MIDDSSSARWPAPSRELVDNFVNRYNEKDLPALLELMLDTASVDMLGSVAESGRADFEREGGWFYHNFLPLDVYPESFRPESLRWATEAFRGEDIILVLFTFGGQEMLHCVMRLEEFDGRIARIRVYACCPGVVQEVGEALELPVMPAIYRVPDFDVERG